MTADAQGSPSPAELLPWLRGLPARPLCPVPWEGNTVVTSDGAVQLCCFSDAVVGNVKQAPFEQVWNGPQMQRIRRTLLAGALPRECRSGSCPFFRGDTLHYLIDRRDGAFRDGASVQVQAMAAQRLAGSDLVLSGAAARRDERVGAELQLRYQGEAATAAVYACLVAPDGALRFLPHGLDFPAPFADAVSLVPPGTTLTVLDEVVDDRWPPGGYELVVALFLPDSDPNLAQHCYWATRGVLRVTP